LNGTNVFAGPVTAPSFSGNGSSLGGVAPASGSTNYVAKAGDTMTGTLNLPANGLLAGGNQLVLAGGNVGIGNNNPRFALEVQGTNAFAIVAGRSTGDQVGFGLYHVDNVTNDQIWGLELEGASPKAGSALDDLVVSDGNGANYLTIKSAINGGAVLLKPNGGNVGIGTTNPYEALEVQGSDAFIRVDGRSNNDHVGFAMYHNTGPTNDQIWAFEMQGSSPLAGSAQDDLVVLDGGGNNYITVKSGAGPVLLKPNGGNVGIGTTTPSASLHIYGDRIANKLKLEVNDTSWGTQAQFNNFRFIDGSVTSPTDGSPKSFEVGAGGVGIGFNPPTYGLNDALYVNGNVGIGTTTPGQKLDVNGAIRVLAGNAIVFDNSTDSGNTQLYYDGSELVSDHRVWVNGGGLIVNSGNVGIGTAAPASKLHLGNLGFNDGLILDSTGNGGADGGNIEWRTTTARHWNIDQYGLNPDLRFFTADASDANGATVMTISGSGNVGIGTTAPQATLHVNGSMIVNGTNTVKVLSITGGADVAEPFAMTGGDIPKGAVVVIDDAHPGQLKLSQRAYDKRVAGIVSGAGGVNPGLTLSQQCLVEGGQNVALTGRVYALADAANAPIEPGDLLTTSAIPGHAMKVTDAAKSQGAIIGKAMSHLETGRGLVLVLVTLQ